MNAFNYNSEFRHHSGKRSYGGENRSRDNADGGDVEWNLHEGMTGGVPDDNAARITFLDEFADFVNQVSGVNLNLFKRGVQIHLNVSLPPH